MSAIRRHTPVDRQIAAVGRRQYGVVSIDQLRGLGLSTGAIQDRLRTGRLHRIHHGVYAVGHSVLVTEGHLMAAVLACGPGAVLSHRSAADHWGLRSDSRSAIDITSPKRTGRKLPGIDAHSGATVRPEDVTEVRGIPCTAVPRTLLDLAEVIGPGALERACDQAEVLRIFDLDALCELIQRSPGRRGAGRLRRLLRTYEVTDGMTRRELEERFLALCLRAGLPRPRVNAWLTLEGEAHQVDFLWSAEHAVVETDGWEYHRTRRAFEADRRRSQLLLRTGYERERFTWRQVTREPAQVAATLETLLARGSQRRGWDSNPRGA
jgi:Transcriptional regulator, AbiEi antitoxin/Protein of unknown function (DUF559)